MQSKRHAVPPVGSPMTLEYLKTLILWFGCMVALLTLAVGVCIVDLLQSPAVCYDRPVDVSDVAADQMADILSQPIFNAGERQATIRITEAQMTSYLLLRATDSSFVEGIKVLFGEDDVCLAASSSRSFPFSMTAEIRTEVVITPDGSLTFSHPQAKMGPFVVPSGALDYIASILNDSIAVALSELMIDRLDIANGQLVIHVRRRAP